MLSASVTHYIELNGDHNIKAQIFPQKHYDINNITDMMTLEYNDLEYKIVYVDEKTIGDTAYLDVRGIPLFYDVFRSTRIYPTHNGSMTAVDCFTQLFAGSGYNFALVDPAYASTWQNFGAGKSRMELFKSALEHYEYEFYVQGSTVYLRNLIGNDTNYLYKYRLNASNVSRTTDATAFATYIKGYGGFEEGETDFENNAKLKMDYTHPLADIPGIGIRHAKPVTDGRITNPDTMQPYMERALEKTLMITVEANLHDVRQMGYTSAVPQIGDRTFLMDERINLDTEIRVHSVETVTDAKGRLIDCKVEFGSQSIRKRYKSNLKTLSRNMEDLLNGNLQLPYNVLANSAKDMMDKIKSVDSELLLENGIFAVDKENPNNIVGLNSAGWFISTDGGATAEMVATAEGLVANSIKTGDLMTHLVRVVGTEGLFYIDGDVFRAINPNNPDRYTEITPEKFLAHKTAFELIGYDGRQEYFNGIRQYDLDLQIQPFNREAVVQSDNRGMYTHGTSFNSVYIVRTTFKAQYLRLDGVIKLRGNSPSSTGTADIRIEDNIYGIPVVTKRVSLGKSYDESENPTLYWNIDIDLKDYYSGNPGGASYPGHPDKRKVTFYVQIRLVNKNDPDDELEFRVNRGWMDG